MREWLLVSLFLVSVGKSIEDTTTVYACDATNCNNSFIYCSGNILAAVNYYQMYNDSKTFVDMPMKFSPTQTQADFDKMFPNQTMSEIDPDKLKQFVNDHFTEAGSELQDCDLPDWQANPSKLQNITDPTLRQWALELNGIWKKLCKKMDPALENDSRYSILYVPHHFIVPGGRFREFYYWDAYWIVKGLIASEMYNTTRSMILNLGSMVEKFGFVPNGGRVYYLQRSQPPFLSAMVYEYYEATGDKDFVAQIVPILEKELAFWKTNRAITVNINGANHTVYQYHAGSNMPRPESYSEDVRKAANVTNQNQFYSDIASSAESGWDFSTRWFSDQKTIYHVETTNVAPVELNSYLCWNLDILEFLQEELENFNQSEVYRNERAAFRNTVQQVFYNNNDGTWYDYNLRTKSQNANFYPSNTIPLFTGCYNSLDQSKAERLYAYMNKVGVFDFASGIPASIIQDSQEQWDFPNGWSPLNHMIIEGLRKSKNPEMQDQAFKIAKKWVNANYRVWERTGHMYEKYNVIGTYPQPGSGGEYDVQDGFGWTNGVILDLLVTYNDRMTLDSLDSTLADSTESQTTKMRTTRLVTTATHTPVTKSSADISLPFLLLLISAIPIHFL